MMHGHYSNEIYDTVHLCVGGFRNSIRTEPKNSRQYKINNGAAAGGEYILCVFLIVCCGLEGESLEGALGV